MNTGVADGEVSVSDDVVDFMELKMLVTNEWRSDMTTSVFPVRPRLALSVTERPQPLI